MRYRWSVSWSFPRCMVCLSDLNWSLVLEAGIANCNINSLVPYTFITRRMTVCFLLVRPTRDVDTQPFSVPRLQGNKLSWDLSGLPGFYTFLPRLEQMKLQAPIYTRIDALRGPWPKQVVGFTPSTAGRATWSFEYRLVSIFYYHFEYILYGSRPWDVLASKSMPTRRLSSHSETSSATLPSLT